MPAVLAAMLVVGCAGQRGPQEEPPTAAEEAEKQAQEEKSGESEGAKARSREEGSEGGATARGLEERGPESTEALQEEDGDEKGESEEAGRPEEKRVYFEFDSASIDEAGRDLLRRHAAYGQANPDLAVILEGHTDERGTREYNMALGERRAKSAAKILTVQGLSRDRIEVVSYGEERPRVDESNQEAWDENRRVVVRYEESADGGDD